MEVSMSYPKTMEVFMKIPSLVMWAQGLDEAIKAHSLSRMYFLSLERDERE